MRSHLNDTGGGHPATQDVRRNPVLKGEEARRVAVAHQTPSLDRRMAGDLQKQGISQLSPASASSPWYGTSVGLNEAADDGAPKFELSSNGQRELSRRDAIRKAIIGGGVAATVWSAPKIEGFSVAPDYASAASGTSGSKGGTVNSKASRDYNCFCFGFGNACCRVCWGNTNGSNCNGTCGNCTNNCANATTGSISFPKNIGPDIALNYAANGDVVNGGTLNLNLSGIDPPFQHCNVNVSGTCNSGAISASTIRCNGMNCSNGNAAVTISLECNFA